MLNGDTETSAKASSQFNVRDRSMLAWSKIARENLLARVVVGLQCESNLFIESRLRVSISVVQYENYPQPKRF